MTAGLFSPVRWCLHCGRRITGPPAPVGSGPPSWRHPDCLPDWPRWDPEDCDNTGEIAWRHHRRRPLLPHTKDRK